MLSGIWIFHRFRLINENLSRSMSRDVRASVAREFESATRDIPGVTLRPAEEANTAQWVAFENDDCGDFISIFVFFQIVQCDRRGGVKLKTSVSDWPTFQLKPMWSELKSAVVRSDMIGPVISVISLHHHSFDQCWQWRFDQHQFSDHFCDQCDHQWVAVWSIRSSLCWGSEPCQTRDLLSSVSTSQPTLPSWLKQTNQFFPPFTWFAPPRLPLQTKISATFR